MKTLVIEAIPLLCEALVSQLKTDDCIASITTATDLTQALRRIAETTPDLIWLDGTCADVKQGQAIKQIHRLAPFSKILIFGVGETIPEIKNYFKQGIHAYLPKSAGPDEICAALASVAAGSLYVPPSLNRAFTSWITDPMRKKKPGCELTQREKEVLSLIVEEHTTGEIAKKLFISYCTVETHRINLIQKLGVKNTAGLVRVAFEAGLYNRGIV